MFVSLGYAHLTGYGPEHLVRRRRRTQQHPEICGMALLFFGPLPLLNPCLRRHHWLFAWLDTFSPTTVSAFSVWALISPFQTCPFNSPYNQTSMQSNLLATNDFFGVLAAVTDQGIALMSTKELVNRARAGYAEQPPQPAADVAMRNIPFDKPVSHLSFNG